jgi:hypothetical protein
MKLTIFPYFVNPSALPSDQSVPLVNIIGYPGNLPISLVAISDDNYPIKKPPEEPEIF